MPPQKFPRVLTLRQLEAVMKEAWTDVQLTGPLDDWLDFDQLLEFATARLISCDALELEQNF